MNFMQAVEEAKKGKHIKVPGEDVTFFWEDGELKGYYDKTENILEVALGCRMIELTQRSDWQVVEDDWNLADNSDSLHSHFGTGWRVESLKKCRDLILEDIENTNQTCPDCRCEEKERKCVERYEIYNIINKRFGDL